MNSNLLKFRISELVKFRDGIVEREKSLRESLNALAFSKKKINDILSEFKSDQENGIVFLPKSELDAIRANSTPISSNFNWKKTTMDILENADGLISTSEIYVKAKIKYPIELIDKKKAIRGFSSVLQYLLSENKIDRVLDGKKHLYGIKKKNKLSK